MNNEIEYQLSFQISKGTTTTKYDVVLMVNQFIPFEMLQLFRRIITVNHPKMALQSFTVVIQHDGFHCFQFGPYKLKPDNFIPSQYRAAFERAYTLTPGAFDGWLDEYIVSHEVLQGAGMPGRKLLVQTTNNRFRDHTTGPAFNIGVELFHCNGAGPVIAELPEGFDLTS